MEIKDCDLLVTTTGLSAGNLRSLRDCMEAVPAGSIYHHFYGRLLRPVFDEPEYNNDFASWVNWHLKRKALAEKLSMVVPSDFDSLEDVRGELVRVIDDHIAEAGDYMDTPLDGRFRFLRGHMVIFDSGMSVEEPADLFKMINHLSQGSIYYHFVDARFRRLDHGNDFSAWFEGLGAEYAQVAERLMYVDPYFSSVEGIRRTLIRILETTIPGHVE